MTSKKIFAADFETTVYDGQVNTEVWAAAVIELYTDTPIVFHSIDALFDYFTSFKCNIVCYFHNLKFDGMFWISYFLRVKKFVTAVEGEGDKREFVKNKYMDDDTFKYSISDRGQFYTLTWKHRGMIVELRDSLKLLPFSLEKIGKNFGTKHQKLSMKYEGYRYAGCHITDEELEYIKNDVYVLKEALEIMFAQGHKKLTIGSCCLSEFKSEFHHKVWNELFPNLKEVRLDVKKHRYKNADEWIRKSYKGGWCYVVPEKSHKIIKNGCTADVNSLYPSQMQSESGNQYPVGNPTFWVGDIPQSVKNNQSLYYFVRFRCEFDIKDGYLPFVQIKSNMLYNPHDCLTTSKIWSEKNQEYCERIVTRSGEVYTNNVEMTMTMVEFDLFMKHYNVKNLRVIDGCYFLKDFKTFDKYIEKYAKIKKESVGAIRELAKLYLNNLYGKLATSDNASFKIAYVKDDGSLGFETVINHEKEPIYIAIGSAITSYARNFTIRHAQKNFHGVDKRGFVYADTDSIHCDLSPSELIDINVHPTDFNHWKIESEWDYAYFVRQKTYIEHVTKQDGESVKPYHLVKCAGMPDRCKKLFLKSLEDLTNVSRETLLKDGYSEEEIGFVKTRRTIEDFDVGLVVPSKLKPKQIKGGVLLVRENFEMRGQKGKLC